jgi:hypothetical protein
MFCFKDIQWFSERVYIFTPIMETAVSTSTRLHGIRAQKVKGKGKVHPRTGHEGPERE